MSNSHGEPSPQGATLGSVDCWGLLERATVGRFAVRGEDGAPDIFPVSFLVHGGSLFVRSAPGAKVRALAAEPQVAFEVDGEDSHVRWSVVIRGRAVVLEDETRIETSGVRALASAVRGERHVFIELIPDTVTGRVFQTPPREEASPQGNRPTSGLRDGAWRKPRPIPHLPPPRTS